MSVGRVLEAASSGVVSGLFIGAVVREATKHTLRLCNAPFTHKPMEKQTIRKVSDCMGVLLGLGVGVWCAYNNYRAEILTVEQWHQMKDAAFKERMQRLYPHVVAQQVKS